MATERDESGDRELSDEELTGVAGGMNRSGGTTLQPDDLMSASLKLNLTDPNNNPATHAALHELMGDVVRKAKS